MALTRKYLKALGIGDDAIEQIIEAHGETVSGLKEQIDALKVDSDRLESVTKELEAAKAGDDYKAKYLAEKKAHEEFRAKIDSEKARGAKEAAVRAYYESKNITGKNLDIALRGTDIDSIEMDGDSIKDASKIDELIGGVYSSLVVTRTEHGADVPTPPTAGGKALTMEDFRGMSSDEINANWGAYLSAQKGK